MSELSPLLVKLGIAVLCVVCWICVAGGVLVWSEGGQYDYWDSLWSAFNLLTTISVGSIATPFSVKTSSFFVWYLLLGVGTLAYCFALIAQIAFIAFDKRQAVHHKRIAREAAQRSHLIGTAHPSQSSSTAAGRVSEDEAFVAHAKEMDQLILQLVHQQEQAAAEGGVDKAEQQQRAFMRSPVLMLGRGGPAGGGADVELPLEGVSLLLRYHLAFQAFEKEKIRVDALRRAKAAQLAQQRASRRTAQQQQQQSQLGSGEAATQGEGGRSAERQRGDELKERCCGCRVSAADRRRAAGRGRVW